MTYLCLRFSCFQIPYFDPYPFPFAACNVLLTIASKFILPVKLGNTFASRIREVSCRQPCKQWPPARAKYIGCNGNMGMVYYDNTLPFRSHHESQAA